MSTEPTIAESDAMWREDQQRNGWKLPPAAPKLLRLPIIRYPRYLFHAIRAELSFQRWYRMGIGIVMNPYDRWILYALYRGWW